MRGFLAAMDAAGVAAVTPVALIMSSRVGVSIDGRGSALLDSREAVAPSPPRAGRHVSRTRRRAGARAGTLTPAPPANRRAVPGGPEPPHPLNQVAKPHAASPPRAQGFAGDRLTQPRTRDRLTAGSSESERTAHTTIRKDPRTCETPDRRSALRAPDSQRPSGVQ